MLRHAIRTGALGAETGFSVLVQNDEASAKLVRLKAVSGPGDETIMLPDED
jgi:hypothetical protein